MGGRDAVRMPDEPIPAPLAPAVHAWLVPWRLAVAERPGGGGRTHRRSRRFAEMAWWSAHGVCAVVSGMRSRHGLADYAAAGWEVRWHPLATPREAVAQLPALVASVRELLDAHPGAVLVHCDLPGEYLASADAALRLGLGLAGDRHQAFVATRRDGLPVGSIASSLVGRYEPAAT